MNNRFQKLEAECWNTAINCFMEDDCKNFCKYMAILTTNRTYYQRLEIFNELYERLKGGQLWNLKSSIRTTIADFYKRLNLTLKKSKQN